MQERIVKKNTFFSSGKNSVQCLPLICVMPRRLIDEICLWSSGRYTAEDCRDSSTFTGRSVLKRENKISCEERAMTYR